MTGDEYKDTELWKAYAHVQEAKQDLTAVAQALGYDDIHKLGDAAMDGEFDDNRKLKNAILAVTNSHSYLCNGDTDGFVAGIADERLE